MSLLGFVCVPQTDTCSSYLAVESTHTAVGHFRSLVRWSGIRCLTNSEIWRVVLTVLSSFLRQSCLVYTNVTSALEVFKKCYALYKSTFYLLTYLLSSPPPVAERVKSNSSIKIALLQPRPFLKPNSLSFTFKYMAYLMSNTDSKILEMMGLRVIGL